MLEHVHGLMDSVCGGCAQRLPGRLGAIHGHDLWLHIAGALHDAGGRACPVPPTAAFLLPRFCEKQSCIHRMLWDASRLHCCMALLSVQPHARSLCMHVCAANALNARVHGQCMPVRPLSDHVPLSSLFAAAGKSGWCGAYRTTSATGRAPATRSRRRRPLCPQARRPAPSATTSRRATAAASAVRRTLPHSLSHNVCTPPSTATASRRTTSRRVRCAALPLPA